ncbi:MAG: mechanosensitive ion channel domain-containing protein [Polyangiaceae bacterium]
MPTLERLKTIAGEPLLRLAGGPITLGSLLTGLLIIVVSYLLASAASHTLTRVLSRREVGHGARFALAKMARYVIMFVGSLVAVTALGIRLDALLAASTVVLVGIGLGLQNIAQNFVSGLILLIERPVARGDFVEIGQARGSVMDVGMRATRVVTRDEVTIIVPNSELISAQVINHSVPTTHLRIAVRVGVAYGTETARVKDALLAVARAEPALLAEPAPEVRFDNFGESSLDFSLLVWIDNPREDLRIASRLRFAIDAAFRAARIEIPFPQRDVHIIRAAGG